MKIFQPLTLILLLVLLAMAWATWDMQRREAVAPGVDAAALQLKTPPAVTNATSKVTAQPPRPAMTVCPTCRGQREVHLDQEVACRACGGTGIMPGKFTSHGTTVCNACKGTGKIAKHVTQDCPTCKRAGEITQAMAANFKTCPKCRGTKTIETELQITCQNCRGSGKNISEMTKRAAGACPFCDGTGKIAKKEKTACTDCFGSGVTYQPPPPPAPAT